MCLPTGAMASGVLDAAAADGPAAAAPRATVALLFITGHMLSRMSAWACHTGLEPQARLAEPGQACTHTCGPRLGQLHGEWSRGGLRIVTCVEALDECVDFEEGLFAGGGDERAFEWPVHRGHAQHGVRVYAHGTWDMGHGAWGTTATPWSCGQ